MSQKRPQFDPTAHAAAQASGYQAGYEAGLAELRGPAQGIVDAFFAHGYSDGELAIAIAALQAALAVLPADHIAVHRG